MQTDAQVGITTEQTRKNARTRCKTVLLLPYLGLCFPQIYARATPALFGMPFFYWYQFAWVIATAALLAAVYRKLRY